MLKSLASLSHAALIALISLVISGCHKERSYPVYRENPVPADALPIIIRVHDAPLEIPTPKVSVTYQIDPLCLPPINNCEGVQYEPNQHTIDLPVRRISATEFSSTVFKDGMEVADYYGSGPCTWTPALVEASFAFIIDDRPIRASVSALFSEIEGGKTFTAYIKRALPAMTTGQTPSRTPTEPSSWYEKMPQDKRKEYFPIEVSTRVEGTTP